MIVLSVVAAVIGSIYYFIVVCLGKDQVIKKQMKMQLTQALAVKVAKYGTHMYNLSILHLKTREVAVITQLCCYRPMKHVNGGKYRSVFFRTDHVISYGLDQDYLLPHVPPTIPSIDMAL